MNMLSVKLTAMIINILTVTKVLALVFIIVLGVWQLIVGGECIAVLGYTAKLFHWSIVSLQITMTILQVLLKALRLTLVTFLLLSIPFCSLIVDGKGSIKLQARGSNCNHIINVRVSYFCEFCKKKSIIYGSASL